MLEALETKPLVVAVNATDDWFYYDSGIMDGNTCQGSANTLNHAVVLVGYNDGDGSNDDDNDDGGDDGGDNGADLGLVVYERVERTCRRQKWSDRQSEDGCTGSDEELIDGRFCCTEEIYNESSYQLRNSGEKFWKVQNSWGTSWGDDGFIYMSVEDGNGTCGINVEVLAVNVA